MCGRSSQEDIALIDYGVERPDTVLLLFEFKAAIGSKLTAHSPVRKSLRNPQKSKERSGLRIFPSILGTSMVLSNVIDKFLGRKLLPKHKTILSRRRG